MAKITISTYLITEVGYGEHKDASQYWTSIITSKTIKYVPIIIEPGVEKVELIDQTAIMVPDWLENYVAGYEFKTGYISLWADGKHDYFAAKYMEIEGDHSIKRPLVNFTYPNKSIEEVDKDIEMFGHELVELWNRLPKINKDIPKEHEYEYDDVYDDTHKGLFFGIENRD